MQYSIRLLLFFALIALTTFPVLMLGIWAHKSTLKWEYEKVEQKHLLLSRNLTLALDRYATDIKSVFHLISSADSDSVLSKESIILAKKLNFNGYQVFGKKGSLLMSNQFFNDNPIGVPESVVTRALKTLDVNGDEILIHPAHLNILGVPRFYLSRKLQSDNITISELSMDYFNQLQGMVRFGESGHAAIIDQVGTVMAHPNSDWQAETKNLASLEPVQAMMRGETGVMEFYVPFKEMKMVAGYAVVPQIGWGVITYQESRELEQSAYAIKMRLWSVLAIGIAITTLFAWWLSRWIISPLKHITQTAVRMNKGELSARVLPFITLPGIEFRVLGEAFDQMAQSLQNHNATLQIELEKYKLNNTEGARGSETSAKVLVIDDSPVNLLELTGWLSKTGFRTYSALSTEESLKIASVIRPDVAIVNMLSVLDGGFQSRVKLISLLKGVNIPIISVFPDLTQEALVQELELDTMAFVVRPIQEKQIVELVNDILEASSWKNLDVKLT